MGVVITLILNLAIFAGVVWVGRKSYLYGARKAREWRADRERERQRSIEVKEAKHNAFMDFMEEPSARRPRPTTKDRQ